MIVAFGTHMENDDDISSIFFFFFFSFLQNSDFSGVSKFINKCQKEILRCTPPSRVWFFLHHIAGGFPIVGGMGGTSHLPIFFKSPPHHQNRCPPWGTPLPLKMKPSPSEKQTPPPPQLKHETPCHEMIPRKSTINNNLKSS